MIDPTLAIIAWLQTDSAITAAVGENIFAPVLPEGTSMVDGQQAAIVVRKRGGHSHPEIPPLLGPSFEVECWAYESPNATALYGLVRDLVHGANNVNLGAAGYIISAQEEIPGQDIIDPDTHWPYVLAIFQILLRAQNS